MEQIQFKVINQTLFQTILSFYSKGIDSILSIYDNGIQITFARQPHVVIFFPISSLIYCASLRFSVVENDQTSLIDWRFITIDSTIQTQSKHPPLFCAVVHRTQILTGDECHCFITKTANAANALVLTISQVYGNIKSPTTCLKSPIFYQVKNHIVFCFKLGFLFDICS
jgi:hypothetical protein